MAAGEFHHGIAKSMGDSKLEGARNGLYVSSADSIEYHCLQQRTKIEFVAGEGKGIRLGIGRAACELFQPHSSLAFKSCFARKTQQSRSAVEEAANGGRHEGTNVLTHQLHRLPITLGKCERPGKHVGKTFHLVEKSGGCLCRIARSGVAPSERRSPQMGHARETVQHAAHENLPSPDRTVVAISGAVEAHADDPLRPFSSLRKDGCDMGTMMLYGAGGGIATSRRVSGRAIFGMKIVDKQQFVPANFVHGDEIVDGLLKCLERLIVIQVTDVLTDERLAVDDERDGVFQLRTQGENGAPRGKSGNSAGCITPSATQYHRTENSGTGNRVVDSPRDRTLADQKRIGNSGQALQRVVIFVGDGFTRSIGAGHDQDIGSSGGK